MDLLEFLFSFRDRVRSMVGIAAFSLLCLLCGGVMAFGFAPAQAIQAYRISRLPVTESSAQIAAAKTGEELVFTGVLKDNAPVFERFVAYTVEEWQVTMPSGNSGESTEPSGHWESLETVVPALTLTLKGEPISLLATDSARLSGKLHELMLKGDSPHQADYEGKPLPDGTRRYQGFFDGDLVTVLGKKSASGSVLPDQLFGGDRLQFEAAQRQMASGLFMAGVCLMGLAPLLLIGGLLFMLWRK